MIEYKTPSLISLQNRKFFHKCHRKPTENNGDWFTRLRDSVSSCSYGIFSSFMLIDKFVSELNDENFEKISKKSTWSEELIKCLKENELSAVDTEINKKDMHLLLYVPMEYELDVSILSI